MINFNLKKCCRIGTTILTMLIVPLLPAMATENDVKISIIAEDENPLKVIVSMDVKNAAPVDFFRILKEKTGNKISFAYVVGDLSGIKNINLKMNNATVESILKKILENHSNLTYTVVKNTITIKKVPVKTSAIQKKVIVTGTVTCTETKKVVVGATVIVQGGSNGAITNEKGGFSLEAEVGQTIEISYVGMHPTTYKIGQTNTNIVIPLKQDLMDIDNVVITGYSNINKNSFTGNAKTVKGDDLLKVSRTNVLKALSTFDASFKIAENNLMGSDPNSLPDITIRGRSSLGTSELDKNKDQFSRGNLEKNPNTPTFIIDGFEVSLQKVYDLDPSRIQFMTILKDAAATAMYGSRAANGVVVITTYPPKAGELRVTYNLTTTLEAPDLTAYNLMNAREKLETERLSGLFEPTELEAYPGYITYLEKYNEIYVRGVETDWMALPLRTAFKHKHSATIEGGTKEILYNFDLNYTGDNGVMKGSSRQLGGAGFTLNFNFGKLHIRNYVSYTQSLATNSPYGSFSDFSHQLPYNSYMDDDGNLLPQIKRWSSGSTSSANPMYEAKLKNFDKDKSAELLENLQLRWQFNEFLLAQGSFGISKRWNNGGKFIDPKSAYSSNSLTTENLLAGDMFTSIGEDHNMNGKLAVSYNRTIGVHNINFSVNGEVSESRSDDLSTHYIGFPSGKLSSVNYAAEVKGKPQKYEGMSRTMGVSGVLNYSIDNIYLSDISVRYEGSSMFGTKEKGAPYWSGGLGINIHNYKFMQPYADVLSRLKVRASYGQLGNVNFPSYAAQNYYENMFDDWYITGYGVKMKYLGNPNLKGEKTHTLDAGIDVSLFNGRFNVIGTFYDKKTVDMINDVTIPSSSGFTVYKDNLGKVRNRGYEIELFASIVRKEDFNISVNANFASNKNTMLEIAQSLKSYNERVNDYYEYDNTRDADSYAKVLTKYEEGVSMTAMYGMKSLGIDPATGDEIFMTRGGAVSNVWSAREMINIGDTEAKGQGSFGFNAQYKGFTLSAVMQYEFGGYRYNETLRDYVENARIDTENVDRRVLTQRWQKPGDITPLKDIKDRNQTTKPTSRFSQEYNVLSLTSLTLQYEFNREFIKKLRLERVRLEANCGELFRLSSVKQERGLSYPFAKNFNFTLMVNF